MDRIIILHRDGTSTEFPANFGVDVPRKGDWLQIDKNLVLVHKIVRHFRGQTSEGTIQVQHDREVWAEGIKP